MPLKTLITTFYSRSTNDATTKTQKEKTRQLIKTNNQIKCKPQKHYHWKEIFSKAWVIIEVRLGKRCHPANALDFMSSFDNL